MEIFVEYFNKIVNSFKIDQVIITDINTDAKIQPSITSVNDLEVSKLKVKFRFYLFQQNKIQTSTKFVCFASRTVTTA